MEEAEVREKGKEECVAEVVSGRKRKRRQWSEGKDEKGKERRTWKMVNKVNKTMAREIRTVEEDRVEMNE